MDNNRVAVLDEKYASCRKIPRDIVRKEIIKELLQIGGSGRGEYMEDQGSTGGRGHPFPPQLEVPLEQDPWWGRTTSGEPDAAPRKQ